MYNNVNIPQNIPNEIYREILDYIPSHKCLCCRKNYKVYCHIQYPFCSLYCRYIYNFATIYNSIVGALLLLVCIIVYIRLIIYILINLILYIFFKVLLLIKW